MFKTIKWNFLSLTDYNEEFDSTDGSFQLSKSQEKIVFKDGTDEFKFGDVNFEEYVFNNLVNQLIQIFDIITHKYITSHFGDNLENITDNFKFPIAECIYNMLDDIQQRGYSVKVYYGREIDAALSVDGGYTFSQNDAIVIALSQKLPPIVRNIINLWGFDDANFYDINDLPNEVNNDLDVNGYVYSYGNKNITTDKTYVNWNYNVAKQLQIFKSANSNLTITYNDEGDITFNTAGTTSPFLTYFTEPTGNDTDLQLKTGFTLFRVDDVAHDNSTDNEFITKKWFRNSFESIFNWNTTNHNYELLIGTGLQKVESDSITRLQTKLSAESGNTLELKNDGLFVPTPSSVENDVKVMKLTGSYSFPANTATTTVNISWSDFIAAYNNAKFSNDTSPTNWSQLTNTLFPKTFATGDTFTISVDFTITNYKLYGGTDIKTTMENIFYNSTNPQTAVLTAYMILGNTGSIVTQNIGNLTLTTNENTTDNAVLTINNTTNSESAYSGNYLITFKIAKV